MMNEMPSDDFAELRRIEAKLRDIQSSLSSLKNRDP